MTSSKEEGLVHKQVPFTLFSEKQKYMQSQFKLMTSRNQECPVHNQVPFTLFSEE